MSVVSIHDHYAKHLAEVDKSNSVITMENICNEQGALIVPKGTNITEDISQKIIKYKLLKPLETCVALDKSINIRALKLCLGTLPIHPEIDVLISDNTLATIFVRACNRLADFPLILQKLTVLSARLPTIYDDSLLGAWVCMVLAHELQLDEDTTNNIFIAALCRDLGLLHIDPDVVLKKGKYSNKEWLLFQGHVAISHHFLTLVPGLPKIVGQAVLEHHEKTDGTGHPMHKTERTLCKEGQLVAFVDTTVGLYKKYVGQLGYSLQAMVPILQINSGTHLHENSDAGIRILTRMFAPMDRRYPNVLVPKLIHQLTQTQPQLKKWFELALKLNNILVTRYNSSRVQQAVNMINRIGLIIASAGLSDDVYIQWLAKAKVQKFTKQDFLEIEQFALMTNEVIWQFQQLKRLFVTIIKAVDAPEIEVANLHKMQQILDAHLEAVSFTLEANTTGFSQRSYS